MSTTLAETDELLTELALMPRCPETAAVVDIVLDYRIELAGTEADAYGTCACPCLCWQGASGPDGYCDDCRAGRHSGDR